MTGHSHAAEYMKTTPTVAELEADWAKAQAARDAHIAKKTEWSLPGSSPQPWSKALRLACGA
jgi:hypothetical protein